MKVGHPPPPRSRCGQPTLAREAPSLVSGSGPALGGWGSRVTSARMVPRRRRVRRPKGGRRPIPEIPLGRVVEGPNGSPIPHSVSARAVVPVSAPCGLGRWRWRALGEVCEIPDRPTAMKSAPRFRATVDTELSRPLAISWLAMRPALAQPLRALRIWLTRGRILRRPSNVSPRRPGRTAWRAIPHLVFVVPSCPEP